MHGFRNVSHRHDDALSRIDWAELERLLVTYYREVGWWVEHSGTGGSDASFDGGVDLRIRRDAEVVLVQCKHWNAKQVPHNAVHELLGVMVNEGATGAILVSSGEFTRAAIDAAQRHGHVKLIDGETLRGMLGPLPEDAPAQSDTPVAAHALQQRPRANLLWWLLALAFAIMFVLIIRAMLDRTADTASEPSPDAGRSSVVQPTIVVYGPQRKADEPMRLVEDSTRAM
jgi:restriction system protein